MNTPSKTRVDLHLHTTSSDGTFNPSELVAYAASFGLETISVTDHDTVDGVPEALKAAAELPIEVIPGIEMGSDVGGRDIHVLGYFIDYTDSAFVAYLDELCSFRLTRADEMVRRLRRRGIRITLKDVLDLAGGGVLTRAHIAKAMVAKGFVSNVRDAFDYYLARDRSCYVQKYNYSAADVIAAIHRVGGVSVLAHPGISAVDEAIDDLIASGVMGIEAYCRDHTPDQVKRYLAIADRHKLIVTGGSDDHGPHTPGRFAIGQVFVPDEVVDNLKQAAKKK